ncbi:MAG: DUF6356 family protein [Steroidobacteraceae bacterium]|nr:DUF6356 family protein [Steroidobacteraceae bacterium]
MLKKLFSEHPASVGETYGQHLANATGFGLRMVMGGLACLLHGLLPFLFVKTGSRAIEELHDRMVVNRSRHAGTRCATPAAGATMSAARRTRHPPVFE